MAISDVKGNSWNRSWLIDDGEFLGINEILVRYDVILETFTLFAIFKVVNLNEAVDHYGAIACLRYQQNDYVPSLSSMFSSISFPGEYIISKLN